MSKKHVSFPLLVFAFSLILQIVNNSAAQDVSVQLTVLENARAVEVSGSFDLSTPRVNPRNLSFVNEYAGTSGLGDRISELKLFDPKGRSVSYKRFMAGEYVADGDFSTWQYRVELKPLVQTVAGAHISWSNGETGLLMLGDLLPDLGDRPMRAEVKVRTPPEGWKLFTACRVTNEGRYVPVDVKKVTFVIGRNTREKESVVKGSRLKVLIDGSWQFTDDELSNLELEIFESYSRDLGDLAEKNYQVSIAKFPVKVPVDNWEADTRGNSIVILSSDTPFKSQSVQRLHEQLRHEIFHLWIPNGVDLTGNYDWFYEGFALYQSLKVGLAVNRISFDNYLDTLSRAYDIDRHDSHKLNLIEASKQRWNGTNTQVYARGMLVAFLCDLELLERSKGKTSVTDLVAELYRKHRPPAAAEDGNTAVLALMRSHPELIPIVDQYINGSGVIDWGPFVNAAGLEADTAARLTVSAHLSGNQKDLLDKLGYNNWRKLPRSKK